MSNSPAKSLSRHFSLILLLACAVSAAWAQAPAAVSSFQGSVNGLVTISQGNTLGNAVSGSSFGNGARIVSTSTGSAVVMLANGCRVPLGPNQSVAIDTSLPCSAQTAAVQTTGSGTVVAGASRDGEFFHLWAA